MALPDRQVSGTSQQPARHRCRGIIVAGAIVLFVLALVAGFLTYDGVIGPVGWPTYDATGIFSVQYPPSWTIYATGFPRPPYILPYPPFVTAITTVGLLDPPGTAALVDVTAALYTNDAAASNYFCSESSQPAQNSGPLHSRDFSGISATATGASSWEFDTTTAHIEIDVFTSNTVTVDDILNSIRIANTRLLAC